MSKYFPPKYRINSFHCPHCNVYANQTWANLFRGGSGNSIKINNMEVTTSTCWHCKEATLWLSDKTLYPPVLIYPPPNSDLSDEVKNVFNEAARIAGQSPRAACALLRLAVEILLKQLGEAGTINEGISNLVANGLDPQIQQSLDILRITGNNAVHPGEIDIDDTTDVLNLFELINVIAEALISQPNRIQEMYENLPDESRQAIERRDGN